MNRNYRWFIIVLVFLITFVNLLDRNSIAFAIRLIQAELGFSRSYDGLILAGFGIGYFSGLLFIGVLIDRIGARILWSIIVAVWSLATLLLAFAKTAEEVFLLRVLLGLAEAGHFPLVVRVVSDWLPVKERSRALAWALVAVPFSSLLGGPIIAYIIEFVHWQGLFISLGVVSLVWIPFWWIYFRDKPYQSSRVSSTELLQIEGGAKTEADRHITAQKLRDETLVQFLKKITTNPVYISNNFAVFAFGYMLFFAITWLPSYLEETQGINLKAVAGYLMIPWLTACILLVLGGYLSEKIFKRNGSRRNAYSHIIWICQLISGLAFLSLYAISTLNGVILCLSVGIGFGMMPNAVLYAINSDLFAHRSATAQSITSLVFALSGIVAPLATGFIVDITGSYQGGFILLGVLTLLSVVNIIAFHHPEQEATFE